MTIKTWPLGILQRFLGSKFMGVSPDRLIIPRRSKAPSIPTTPKKVSKHVQVLPHIASPKNTSGLVEQLKTTNRYVVLLLPKVVDNLGRGQLPEVVDTLNREMSLIPAGPVAVDHGYIGEEPDVRAHVEAVESYFIDRFAVTNAEFKQFVDQGGYEEHALWDAEVLPALGEFVDTTRRPGPGTWKDGQYPPDLSEHPVVGISWHEANAYARWVGKRLPTNSEWVKAASWPLVTDGKPTRQRTYPWGSIFEESNSNIWVTGLGHTVRVDEFQNGNSVSDVCQLSGNVWEWTADEFQVFSGNKLVSPDDATKSLRGGAFDTYVERQASCTFESGDSPFARKHNIGFRCVVTVSQLADKARDKIDQLGIKSGPATFADSPVRPRVESPPTMSSMDRPTQATVSQEDKLERQLEYVRTNKFDKNSTIRSNSLFAGPGDME